jgi:hypothetical protein
MNDDKSCFRTLCTYQVQTKTYVTLALLVIYIQYHSFNPTNTQGPIFAELLNVPYIRLFLYTTKVLTANFVFVTALILSAHNSLEEYFNWISPSAVASLKFCSQPTEGAL